MGEPISDFIIGVSVFLDPARLQGVSIPFPVTEHQPLPPYRQARTLTVRPLSPADRG